MAVLTHNGPGGAGRMQVNWQRQRRVAQIVNRDAGDGVWHASGEGNLTDQCYQIALCKSVIFPSSVNTQGYTQARHHARQSKQSQLSSELQMLDPDIYTRDVNQWVVLVTYCDNRWRFKFLLGFDWNRYPVSSFRQYLHCTLKRQWFLRLLLTAVKRQPPRGSWSQFT